MAIGDQADIFGRIKAVLPNRWFGGISPLLDAITQGLANSSAFIYSLYLYAKLQTRILTATDGWLDMVAADFFGAALLRNANQTDASFRARIIINMFRERGTRNAITKVLTDLTGRAPIIFEPQRPKDTGAYGAAVAVSRSTTATYIDGSGILRTAAVNEVRYQNNALLIEAAATNSLTYSQAFDNASYWVPAVAPVAVTPNAAIGPDGFNSAYLLTDTGANNPSLLQVSTGISYPIGTLITCSIFIKQGSSANSTLNCYATGDAETNSTVTWAAGVPSVTLGTITAVANGFYRWSMPVTPAVLGQFLFRFWPLDRGRPLTDAGSVYGYGAQVENGGLTSYIPTFGTTVTRAADVLLNNMTAGSAALGGYGIAGGYGSMLIPFQAFVQAFRPASTGIPYVAGYGSSPGGYGVASRADYATLSQSTSAVTDADLYAAIDSVKPVATTLWTQINS